MRALPICIALCLVYFVTAVTISNVEPRRDTDGDIISAGDGCISYHPDEQRYYLFGAHYQPCHEPDNSCYCTPASLDECSQPGFVEAGSCCGWRNATIASWSSPDLVTWRKEGLNILPILTSDPTSIYSSNYGAVFEPCGVYNRASGFWILYFLRNGYTLANAVSRSAGGPFQILNLNVLPGRIVDFYFWQNATTGELLMKHNGDGGEYALTVAPDYLSITNSTPVFGKELGYTEGGGIFQYGGSTYVMAGHGCCFCTLGSNGYLWGSTNGPLGDYQLLGDFVPRNPNGSSVTQAQQFSVTPVYTTSGTVPMFIGIRFGSAPDFVKDHDFQFWAPLRFDAAGKMINVSWIDSFDVELAPPYPPPPPPPTPAPAWYGCSYEVPGQCVEVPANASGSYPLQSDCTTACAPWYRCSAAGCLQVPANTSGSLPTLTACKASCVMCNLAGVWLGTEKSVGIHISQAPTVNNTAAVVISTSPPAWASNATGAVTLGSLTVTGGWCGGGHCSGIITPLRMGGPPCALIDWGAAGTWCNPELEPKLCS